jgi:serine/threonine protein kinase
MPPPQTAAEFIDLVSRSGVVSPEGLADYLARRDGLPEGQTPQALAADMTHDCLLTPFQAGLFLEGKWRNFTVGNYKVLERLGSGSRSSVYLCEHLRMQDRRVAVKVLAASLAEDPASLERFHREARILACLDHPNVVRAYDLDQDNKLHFLVLEYVDGPSLNAFLARGGPLDVTQATGFIRQAAAGLQHAHEAKWVHRNIKPSHLLVDRRGTVKIVGMGMGYFCDEDGPTKRYEAGVLGTADYLAPEQALDSHGVDIRADIYSLGATFYRCLTGQPLFADGTVVQKLIWHQTRTPRPVRELRPEVPEGVATVLDRMLAKDPAQRYQSPAELMQALDALPLPKDGPPARPPSPWPAEVTALAEALAQGERCHFALCDALLEAGHSEVAEHFRAPAAHYLPTCWALERILQR